MTEIKQLAKREMQCRPIHARAQAICENRVSPWLKTRHSPANDAGTVPAELGENTK